MAKQTASQTIGPYFSYGLTPEAFGRAGIAGNVLANEKTTGVRLRIEGRVFDGTGQAVDDALIEVWQANAAGRHNHALDSRHEVPLDDGFAGFGRCATDAQGRFWFDTIKPGAVPGRGNTLQAPHLNVIVMARGMLDHAFTRFYFSDEADANANDPVLESVEATRRATLIAVRDPGVDALYRLDIRLQGDGETVFFDP